MTKRGKMGLPPPTAPLHGHIENFDQSHCFSRRNLYISSKFHQNWMYLNFKGGTPTPLNFLTWSPRITKNLSPLCQGLINFP